MLRPLFASTLVAVCACVLFAGRCLAQASPSPKANQRVVKLVSTSEDMRFGGFGRGFGRGPGGPGVPGGGGGDNDAYIVVAPPEGGKPVRLNVTAEYRRRLGSLGGERGELVTITLAGEQVSGVTKFEGPRELKNPNTYVFDGLAQKTIAGAARPTVKLSRFGNTLEALVPVRPGLEGMQPQPDEAMMERIKGLAQGAAVQVELGPTPIAAAKNMPTLVDISIPQTPRGADFLKLSTIKDDAGKPLQAIVLEIDGAQETFALPAATPQTPSPAAAAITATARRLKPGYGVHFATTDGKIPVLRDLKLDGHVEAAGEKSLHIRSTYLRVEVSENRFSRGGDGMDVNYRPGVDRTEDEVLTRGVAKVLESDQEISRLKVTPEQVRFLTSAADSLGRRRDERPTPTERQQWITAYRAWFNAANDAARLKVEQEMIAAAQELSLRLRKDYQDALFLMRTTLNSEQLPAVKELGKENRTPGFGGGPRRP